MSYYIDVGEQDKALADGRSPRTRRRWRRSTRPSPTRATGPTCCASRRPPRSATSTRRCVRSRRPRQELRRLERRSPGRSPSSRRATRRSVRNKRNAAAIIRQGRGRPEEAGQRRSTRSSAEQVARGNIPSKFNGTMRWPMDSFTVSGDYGCSSFEYYAPGNGCAHFHNGIDLVGPYGAPIRPRPRQVVVRRLELGRRPRPRLDRRHRPLRQPADVVRPHAAEAAGRCRPARVEGRGHRLRGHYRSCDRRPPPLDGRAQRTTS